MNALSMGAVDMGDDMNGYEAIAAVQDSDGTDSSGRDTFSDADSYQSDDDYSGSDYEN